MIFNLILDMKKGAGIFRPPFYLYVSGLLKTLDEISHRNGFRSLRVTRLAKVRNLRQLPLCLLSRERIVKRLTEFAHELHNRREVLDNLITLGLRQASPRAIEDRRDQISKSRGEQCVGIHNTIEHQSGVAVKHFLTNRSDQIR
jgi:hypothetical protein